MKKGLILINAFYAAEHYMYQAARMHEEFAKLGIETDIRRNDFFIGRVTDGGGLKVATEGYDFCLYLDKDKYVSAMLAKSGLRLFDSHEAISACDDKMTTAILLADNGIPMPETLPGLLCYTPEEKVKSETVEKIERALGYPLIVKTSYGSMGKGVYLAHDRRELEALCEQLKCVPHLFQRFVSSSYGKDIRVIVIGGKYAASMLRSSDGDFRSNLELGGVGKAVEISDKLKTDCEKIARLLALDYCGIDVLIGENGYYICEVNSNAFFGGIEKATGTNIAALYARHIAGVVYGHV